MPFQPARPQLQALEPRVLLSFYWVDPSGDDSSPGSSQAPWRTLQHAVDSIAPGDTILVESGTYAGFQVGRYSQSGQDGAVSTIQADAGAHVVITSPGPANIHRSDIEIEGFDSPMADWVVAGFEVVNAPNYGIDIRGSDAITVRDCYVHDNASTGLFQAFSDHTLFEDNESAFNGEHGIYDSNSSKFAVIRGNFVHDNARNGLHLNGDITSGGDGIIAGTLVEENVIADNGTSGGGSGISCDGVQDSWFQNNLIYGNHTSGIYFYWVDSGGPSRDNTVVNNTVLVPSYGYWAVNIQDFSTGNTVLNNVLYNYHSYRGSIAVTLDSLPGFTSDYNVVMDRFTTDGGDSRLTLAQWQLLTGLDLHSKVATPDVLFADAGANDYHLSAGSPAIGAGTSQDAPAADLDGNPRPSPNGWDVGAYQYWGGSSSVVPVRPVLPVSAEAALAGWVAFTHTTRPDRELGGAD
jgi:hypothetical protein